MRKTIVFVFIGLLFITHIVLLALRLTHMISWPMIYVLLPAFCIFALGVFYLVDYVIKSEEG